MHTKGITYGLQQSEESTEAGCRALAVGKAEPSLLVAPHSSATDRVSWRCQMSPWYGAIRSFRGEPTWLHSSDIGDLNCAPECAVPELEPGPLFWFLLTQLLLSSGRNACISSKE